MSLKNSNDTIGNRTRDLLVSSVVPYASRYSPVNWKKINNEPPLKYHN
jgi:hypothetical protein